MKHKERMQSLVESLPNDGSMVTVFFDKSMERLTKSYKGIRFVLMLSKDRQKISTYHPSYDGGFQLDRAIDGPLTIMDKNDIRLATPEEVKKFMDEITTNEIWELDTENHIIKKRNEDQK
jgi:spore cortex formation protein SpoVR/YcgB (stage V sporulation)